MAGSLAGMRVLVTRSINQAKPFAEQLEVEGAEPVLLPLLTFSKNATKENYDILSQLHEYDWLFFTSANGVKFFFCLMEQWKLLLKGFPSVKFASVGKKTTQSLKDHQIVPDFQPDEFSGKSMVQEFISKVESPGKVLIIAGNLSRDDISRELNKQQVLFQRAVVYDTIMDETGRDKLQMHLKSDDIDIYTFTSPSTVHAFDKLSQDICREKEKIKRNRPCVCIGETTKQAAEQAGFIRISIPNESTIEGMTEIIKKYSSLKGQDE